MEIIDIKNVSKKIKEVYVLRNIDAAFETGKIYGLIGRNGSGKTMLLRMLCGLAVSTEGRILIGGKELGKDMDIPNSIGAIIEVPGFLLNLSGIDNLKYLASLRNIIGLPEIQAAMYKCGLNPKDKMKVGKYSLGMRQRLGIAQAIMENPEILLLDEPMNGLDNQGVEDVKELLKEMRSAGKTIVIASHHMEDITELCDTVYLMESGHLRKAEQ